MDLEEESASEEAVVESEEESDSGVANLALASAYIAKSIFNTEDNGLVANADADDEDDSAPTYYFMLLGAKQDERRMKKLRSSQQQVHNPKPMPDLPDYLIPRLNMRFQDVEKAREFYNKYARHAGFGIRKMGGNDNHKYFVCVFQGKHTNYVSEANRKRNKTSQRTGCNARMRVKVQEDNTCVAVDIEYNHNHQLMQTDDMLVFLHSHKNYDPTILEKAMNAKKDDLDDVLKLLSFFRDMKAINDEFFYDIQVDKDKDEDAKSFKWLFDTFVRCMNNKHPTCILTDQCPSMVKAIPQSFPNTVHKLCHWHILKKYKEYLTLMYKKYKTFKEEFTAILNWSLMPTEFEAAWAELVHKYSLENDQMMMQLWSDRKMWISAYYKNIFCARMTSAQRSESMNHVLKKGFVMGTQKLHMFARRTNPVTKTTYGYEEDMAIKYTRAVYTEMRTRMRKATLFHAKPTAEPTKYLVYYHNKAGHDDENRFAW
ncbi:protein FAR1-RELATED SEQUENCE 5-like [Aegilops tauschii subsp. strangulata]|uniref:protein FAR1-RELATED SEQUENCE 5-like n=1 Tax=Aegilops tauschii subsp. strangulata TaxID=200361 RepID=UPI00098A66BE|nr:protein FAR1-RELATED SEQUENCE 5-like [Aegilops tauschii subsp. strangulata]